MKLRQAVIPAAGLGTRFLPATKSIPKELLPIVDKPIIQYVVEEAAASGISRIILVTNEGKEAIENHFSPSPELEGYLREKGRHDLLDAISRISSMVEVVTAIQDRPLGLGHAVLCAREAVGHEPFAVLLGDDLVDSKVPCLDQMRRVFDRHGAPVIALQRVKKNQVRKYGIIDGKRVDGGVYAVRRLVEKPPPEKAPSRLAIIGRYILRPEIFDILADSRPGHGGEIQLTDALQTYLSRGPIYGLEFRGDRYDAGDKSDFLKATIVYALKRKELRRDLKRFLASLP